MKTANALLGSALHEMKTTPHIIDGQASGLSQPNQADGQGDANRSRPHSAARFSKRDPLSLEAVRRRFRELVVKEALGESAPGDREKLDRYQALLRYRPSAEERSAEIRFRWRVERAMKTLGTLRYKAEQATATTDAPTRGAVAPGSSADNEALNGGGGTPQ